MPSARSLNPEDFAAYYRFAPAALALRECVRLEAVRALEMAEPILDVGCGDGVFARLAYKDRQTWGIDINPSEIQRAQATQSYSTLICGNICGVALPEAFFGSAIANCSLEHVPDLNGALLNIRRSLKDGGRFALIVPTPQWTSRLMTVEVLRKFGLSGLARSYAEGLDKVFAHVHLYDEAGWTEQLERAGFENFQVTPIVTRPATWAFDVLLYPSLWGYFTKKLTGRWVLSPLLRAFSVDAARSVIDLLSSQVKEDGSAGEYLIVCEAKPGFEAPRR